MKLPPGWDRMGMVAAVWLILTATVGAADGPTLFADHCASCHGPDGKARTPAGRKVHAKDLAASHLTDAAIEQQISNGGKDERGRPTMPAFRDQLSPEEIRALIPVVKAFRR